MEDGRPRRAQHPKCNNAVDTVLSVFRSESIALDATPDWINDDHADAHAAGCHRASSFLSLTLGNGVYYAVVEGFDPEHTGSFDLTITTMVIRPLLSQALADAPTVIMSSGGSRTLDIFHGDTANGFRYVGDVDSDNHHTSSSL